MTWKLDQHHNHEMGYDVVDEKGEHVCGPIASEANAAFIVRACNAHKELLEACKNSLRYFELEAVKGAAVCTQAIARAEGSQA